MALRRVVVALCVLAGGLWPAVANACSCASGAPPCDAAWRADAVFVGHVVSIETTVAAGAPGVGRRVELAVVEAFRGLQLSQVALVTGGNNCDYPFTMGESYVVYAHRLPDGQLSTSICARTRPLSQAGEDLAYLRSLATMNPRSPARVDGVVRLFEWPAPVGGLQPAPRVSVSATGNGRTVSARTNERGEFQLNGLSTGTYELKATAPQGYNAVARTIDIHDPRGCGTTVLYLRHDARVSGRVVDSRGIGVGGLPLALLSSGQPTPRASAAAVRAWTRTDGTFELELVQPGTYELGFTAPRPLNGRPTEVSAFYPGVPSRVDATKVVVAVGARVRLADFVVPATVALATVAGAVVDEAGNPVRRARVVLQQNVEGGGTVGPTFVTGEDGRFAFSLVEGARYVVHVTRYIGDERRPTGTQISMVPVTVASATPALSVIMKPNRD